MRHYSAGQRVAQEHGGGEGGGDDAEMRRARQEAHKAQKRYDMESERDFWPNGLPRATTPNPDWRPARDRSADWRFVELKTESGHVDGFRVERNGRLVGMLVMRGADLVAISTSPEEDEDAPMADEIMAAFIRARGLHR